MGGCPYFAYQPPDRFAKEFTSGELSDYYRRYRHYVPYARNGSKSALQGFPTVFKIEIS